MYHHWKYKGNDTQTGAGIESWISQVRDMIESAAKGEHCVTHFFRGKARAILPPKKPIVAVAHGDVIGKRRLLPRLARHDKPMKCLQ